MVVRLDSKNLDDLAEKIRESAHTQVEVKTELATSQRIIARVTDGIYREPWAAFRELVANAYDADASYVVVETGVPEFEQVTVRDDGIGMSPKTLAYVLKSIGGSSKRITLGGELHTAKRGETDKSPGGRPLIGKIGIGLFAIAQLTQHFQIITKAPGERIITSATIRLHTHDDSKFHSDDQEFIAGDVTVKSENVPENEVDAQGTSVVLYTLRPEVRRMLQSFQRWENFFLEIGSEGSIRNAPMYHIGCQISSDIQNHDYTNPVLPWNPADNSEEKFRKLFEKAGDSQGRGTMSANLEHFDEYFKLIWKLSLSLPLNYIDDHPFELAGSSGVIFYDVPSSGQSNRIELSEDETLRVRLGLRAGSNSSAVSDANNPFSVELDGVALRRPIRLPHQLVEGSRARIKAPTMVVAKVANPFNNNQLERAGGPLYFDAYLYWNSKIVPKETVGALIRVREASGTLFDRTFLNYQVSEQTRLRQITAEIFVHEGLDGAINIDRESFNYSHPHFLYIQKWLHRALRLLVNRLKSMASEDLKREREEQQHEVKAALRTRAEMVWQRRYGEEADLPMSDTASKAAPDEVGGVEISWSSEDEAPEPEKNDKTTALAVVLEAYGVLSNLPVRDRSQLIKDILAIFEDK